MTDQQNPVPGESSTPGNPPASSSTNWEAAYKALQSNLNAANTEKAALKAQLDQANAQTGQLQATADNQRIQLEAQLGTLKTQLAETTGKYQTAATKAATLAAEKAKVDALSALDTPDTVKAHLLKMLPTIPTADNPELQTQMIKSFAQFGADVAAAREKELRAGVTPGFGQSSPAPTTPNSTEAWTTELAKHPHGSAAYKATQEQFLTWTIKNQT